MKRYFVYSVLLGLGIGFLNLAKMAIDDNWDYAVQKAPLFLLFYIVPVSGFWLVTSLFGITSYESPEQRKKERQRMRREAHRKLMEGGPKKRPKPAA